MVCNKKEKRIRSRVAYIYRTGEVLDYEDRAKSLLRIDGSNLSIKEMNERFLYKEAWFDEDERYHRKDGPAVIGPESSEALCQQWFYHGKRHREDGPQLILSDGREEYWIDDERIEPETLQIIQNETNEERLVLYITSPSAAERWLAKKRICNLV